MVLMAAAWLSTVSYTHLDVYKRQALIAALVLALLCGIALAVYESRTADLAGWFGGEERNCLLYTSRCV